MNPHCDSRAHCRACLTDQQARFSLKTVSPCPHGITAANLPQPTERDRALHAAARGEAYAPPGRCKGCGS
jgi:hypothetical protein